VEFTSAKLDGKGLKVGIVVARWNERVVTNLADGAIKAMVAAGVAEKDVKILRVAGSYELPFGALALTKQRDIDAVICIGTLIKGETMHFEYISGAVSQAIMDLQMKSAVPVIFGVLTCMTEDQALARAGLPNKSGKSHNHGTGEKTRTMFFK
jgi:6,7-dimethyl-8-ribityllumazine synthase